MKSGAPKWAVNSRSTDSRRPSSWPHRANTYACRLEASCSSAPENTSLTSVQRPGVMAGPENTQDRPSAQACEVIRPPFTRLG